MAETLKAIINRNNSAIKESNKCTYNLITTV